MVFEFQILDYLQTLHSPFMDQFCYFFSKIGNNGLIWILLGILLVCIKKTRPLGITLLLALVLEGLFTDICLKHLVARIRPYDIRTPLHPLRFYMHDYSFPSGHTGAAMASVMALYLADRDKKEFSWLWKLAVLVLIPMAFSRMYFYVHYPTDILGGIAIGVIDGLIANYVVRRFWKV